MSSLQDEIFFPAANASYHVFYVPGNPGLISYYTAFLASLNKQLNQPGCTHPVSIYGKSLSGFEVNSKQADTNGALVDLEGQIDWVEASLHAYAARSRTTEQPRPRVILMGHSVGAYIVMEVLRRHREAQEKTAQPFDVVSCVLLFPTIMDLALSPTGRRIGWFVSMKYTHAILGNFARGLTWILPEPLFSWIVKAVTGMPAEGARVTEAFLRSETGVHEALYLARTELEQITLDKWDDGVWDAGCPTEHPSLYFYFGKEDHWVSNHTREELINTRGQGGGVRMEVDELKIPHAFCIRHSELIAGKVSESIEEIIRVRS